MRDDGIYMWETLILHSLQSVLFTAYVIIACLLKTHLSSCSHHITHFKSYLRDRG